MKYSNDNVVKFLIDAAPFTVGSINLNGNSPLHLALQCGRSLQVIQELVNAQPLAVFIRNNHDETPLDIFFHQMYDDVKMFMDNLPKDYNPNEIMQMNIHSSSFRNKVLKIRDIYEITCLLLKASNIENIPRNQPWLALHAALKTSSCPWVFCEFISRMHPDQISMLDDEGNPSIVLAACNTHPWDDSEQKLQSLFTLVAENPAFCSNISSELIRDNVQVRSKGRQTISRKYSIIAKQ